jgi:ACS family hexuronate transporter-like MFS transporter
MSLFFDRHFKWMICALLFFATTINYLDRQILSLVKPILDQEIQWTHEQFGWVNAAFQGAYAVGLLVFGFCIDRFGVRISYAISIGLWSSAAVAHVFANDVRGFVLARIALGLGEGGNFPAAIKTVAEWFPRKERSLATSIFNSGANIGAILAPLSIPLIALAWSWQAAFVAAGAFGFVWIFFWFTYYREAPTTLDEGVPPPQDDLKSGTRLPVRTLLSARETWAFIAAKFLTDPIFWFFLIWLPDYFHQTRGLNIKQSWVHLSVVYALVTVLSIFGGWLPGYLAQRGQPIQRARKGSMLLFALAVIPVYFATQLGDWYAVLLIGLAGAAHQAWSACLFSTVSDMFPQKSVASVVGVGGMAGAVGGMIFPIFTGTILDYFKAHGGVQAGYELLFLICSSAYMLAFAVHHLLAPQFLPIEWLNHSALSLDQSDSQASAARLAKNS